MPGSKKKATDDDLVAAYSAIKNVWKVAAKFGMCGQSVHERLKRIGVKVGNPWTSADEKVLVENYLFYRDNFKLQNLADRIGRTKQFICNKARALGLTDTSKSYSAGRRTVTKDGYVYIGHGTLEHIMVAEKRLGRPLQEGEVVHHLDGNRQNNDPSNLIVMSIGDHMAYHASKPRKKRRNAQRQL